MHCKLIAVSTPVISECEDAEELVAYCAKVSNPTNQANHGSADKLLRYLTKHEHWSPFEMVSITIEINTTRDIARQILRHRSFSFQEFSQRYAVAQNFQLREARFQSTENRQSSIEPTLDDIDLMTVWNSKQEAILALVQDTYAWALESGIAKEQARAILPEGLTGSTLYMAGTLRSWIHYCKLRTKWDTQKEHREVADACWTLIKKEFPSIEGLIDV